MARIVEKASKLPPKRFLTFPVGEHFPYVPIRLEYFDANDQPIWVLDKWAIWDTGANITTVSNDLIPEGRHTDGTVLSCDPCQLVLRSFRDTLLDDDVLFTEG
eukprot:TRINITY_DN911_c0_g1_i4.p2 TRINITY_DN911_c0_g1~~TRINITY_DN911_c0_g1_i4.p2  ORF type:complete len:103 (-),score=5.99 TRINITY_DN911_c0_g1_i4:20-328(-)